MSISQKAESRLATAILYLIIFLTLLAWCDRAFGRIGVASWYGPGFWGKKTASGETYSPGYTVAHKSFKFNTKLLICTDYENCIVVRVNDRGPYIGSRVLDLNKLAAKELNMINKGVSKVWYREVPSYYPVGKYSSCYDDMDKCVS